MFSNDNHQGKFMNLNGWLNIAVKITKRLFWFKYSYE